MNETTRQLKRTWFFLMLPLLLLGAILYFTHIPHFPSNTAYYWVKSFYLLLVLALVPATSIHMTRALKKHIDQEEAIRLAILSKAYRIRIYTLSSLALVALPLHQLSSDRAYWMVYGVLIILLIINFPSKGMVEKELHKD